MVGFDRSLFSSTQPSLHLVCDICFSVMRDATMVSCGHSFCASCLCQFKGANEEVGVETKCPAVGCGNSLMGGQQALDKIASFPNRSIQGVISDLTVTCFPKSDGPTCDWSGRLGDWTNHCRNDCIHYRKVDCPILSCGQSYKRLHQAWHMEDHHLSVVLDERNQSHDFMKSHSESLDTTKPAPFLVLQVEGGEITGPPLEGTYHLVKNCEYHMHAIWDEVPVCFSIAQRNGGNSSESGWIIKINPLVQVTSREEGVVLYTNIDIIYLHSTHQRKGTIPQGNINLQNYKPSKLHRDDLFGVPPDLLMAQSYHESTSHHLQCPICTQLFENPIVLGNCGHTFCRECMEKVIEMTNQPECPCCRKYVSVNRHQLVSNVVVQQMMQDLEVHCRFCGWKGLYSHWANHREKQCLRQWVQQQNYQLLSERFANGQEDCDILSIEVSGAVEEALNGIYFRSYSAQDGNNTCASTPLFVRYTDWSTGIPVKLTVCQRVVLQPNGITDNALVIEVNAIGSTTGSIINKNRLGNNLSAIVLYMNSHGQENGWLRLRWDEGGQEYGTSQRATKYEEAPSVAVKNVCSSVKATQQVSCIQLLEQERKATNKSLFPYNELADDALNREWVERKLWRDSFYFAVDCISNLNEPSFDENQLTIGFDEEETDRNDIYDDKKPAAATISYPS